MSKYKTLIFDLDGTTVNTDNLIIDTWLKLYDAIEPIKRKTREELAYYSGPSFEENVKQEYPEDKIELCTKIFREITNNLIETDLEEYPGAKEVLNHLKSKGLKLAINTNRLVKYTLKILKTLQYEDIFDVLMCPDFVKKGKPDPEGCLKIIEQTGSKKEECLYIGDTIFDYLTAKNAGIDCVLVNWGPRKFDEEIKPIKFVKSYKELEDFINEF